MDWLVDDEMMRKWEEVSEDTVQRSEGGKYKWRRYEVHQNLWQRKHT